MADNKYIFTLHRYFIWSDRMRVHFEQEIKKKAGKVKYEYDIASFLYMSYWYASMYVIIEGWKQLGLSDPKIDNLLKSANVDLLKRYRNGVFHFQKKYFNERFMDFIDSGWKAIKWIRELRKELSRFFLDWFEQQKKLKK